MRAQPVCRQQWANYYIKRFNKYQYPGSEQMAIWYLLMVEEEKYERGELQADELPALVSWAGGVNT